MGRGTGEVKKNEAMSKTNDVHSNVLHKHTRENILNTLSKVLTHRTTFTALCSDGPSVSDLILTTDFLPES